MKNLFDYATKELSQDAFLRWLFESWKDEEIKPVVKSLLKEFCNLDEEIEEIKTTAQEEYIDIKVQINTISKRKTFLFIEDKTFSSEHKQLKTYDTYIDKISGEKHKVFYKTNKLSDDDMNGVAEANKTNGSVKWKMYDIHKIVQLFEKHAPYKNLILKDYLGHLQKIKCMLENTEKPTTNDSKLDFVKWEAYFNNVIIAKLGKNGYKAESWKAGPYPYVCLVIRKEGFTEKAPYLEVRSRDCLDNNFVGRILLYNVARDDNKFSILKGNIENTTIFKIQNYKQQIGITKEDKKVITDEDFVIQVEKCAEEFLEIMKDWQ